MRYHVINDHCNIIGGKDHGAVDTREEAEEKIVEQKARGNKGGCRCSGSGWRIYNCQELQQHMERTWARYPIFMLSDTHECREYNPRSFNEQMEASDNSRQKQLQENAVEITQVSLSDKEK